MSSDRLTLPSGTGEAASASACIVADESVVRFLRSSVRMNGPAREVMASSVLVGIETVAPTEATGRNELRVGDVGGEPGVGGRFANGRADSVGQSSPSKASDSQALDTWQKGESTRSDHPHRRRQQTRYSLG